MSGYRGRGVHGSTVEVLGARIVEGTLAPGEVLDLGALGEEFDISLTSLREAIKVLTAKGLLDARQKKGTFVRPRAEWNTLDGDVIRWRHRSGDAAVVMRQLAEIREAIEPSAAALAALRRDDEDVVALRAALTAMEDARDKRPRDAADADLQFHQALLDATHNDLFARMSVFVEPALHLRDELVHDHAVSDPVPSHRRLVDAVEAGDVEEARAAALALLAQSEADDCLVLDEDGAADGAGTAGTARTTGEGVA